MRRARVALAILALSVACSPPPLRGQQQWGTWAPGRGAFGDWRWASPQADVATILAMTGAPGQCIAAIDVGVVYCWSTDGNEWVAQSGGGGGSAYWVDPDTDIGAPPLYAIRLNTSTMFLERKQLGLPNVWVSQPAEVAVRLATNPTACAASSWVTDLDADGTLTCAQPDFADLSGAVTDSQVPNNITVSLAATATALAANGTNCSAGNYPLGVDASGNAEGCTAAGAGGSPGGSDTQVQFNDSSAFGGDADLTWDKTNNVLTIASGGKYAISTDQCLQRRDANFWYFTACATSLTGFIAGRSFFSTGTTSSPNLEVDFDPSATVAVRVASSKHFGWSDLSWRRNAGGTFMEPANGGSGVGYVRHVPTDTPPTCNDGARGALYFDDSLGEHCACRGATGAASWQQMDGGGAC